MKDYGTKGFRKQLRAFARSCEIKDGFCGQCPCGGMFAGESEEMKVFHSMPVCKEFRDKEPDEFLAYLNRMFSN